MRHSDKVERTGESDRESQPQLSSRTKKKKEKGSRFGSPRDLRKRLDGIRPLRTDSLVAVERGRASVFLLRRPDVGTSIGVSESEKRSGRRDGSGSEERRDVQLRKRNNERVSVSAAMRLYWR